MRWSKLELNINSRGFGEIKLDGQKVEGVRSVELFVAAGEPPVAKIEVFVDKLEVEVDKGEDISQYPRL